MNDDRQAVKRGNGKGTVRQRLGRVSFGSPWRSERAPAPNSKCPCGSGKKFKKCCWNPS